MEPVLVFFFFFHCFLDSFLLRYRLSTTASLAEANGNCATCDGQGKKGTGLGASRSPRQLFFVHSVASVTVLFFFSVYLSVSFLRKQMLERQEPKCSLPPSSALAKNFKLCRKIFDLL